MNFVDAIEYFDDVGFMDVLIPFVIIFTIVYAILQKTMILGKDKKNFNVVLAASMGLIVVFGHVLSWFPENADPVNIMNKALPNVSILLVGIVMFLLLIGLLGGRATWMGGSLSGWVAIISIIIILYIFGNAAGWWGGGFWPDWLSFMNDDETIALIIIILVFGIVIWFITKEDRGDKQGFRLFNDIGEFFKGKGE